MLSLRCILTVIRVVRKVAKFHRLCRPFFRYSFSLSYNESLWVKLLSFESSILTLESTLSRSSTWRKFSSVFALFYHAWITTLIGAINISWEHNNEYTEQMSFFHIERVFNNRKGGIKLNKILCQRAAIFQAWTESCSRSILNYIHSTFNLPRPQNELNIIALFILHSLWCWLKKTPWAIAKVISVVTRWTWVTLTLMMVCVPTTCRDEKKECWLKSDFRNEKLM